MNAREAQELKMLKNLVAAADNYWYSPTEANKWDLHETLKQAEDLIERLEKKYYGDAGIKDPQEESRNSKQREGSE